MIDRCRAVLLVAAAAYLALLPSGVLSFWRSLAFAVAAAMAIVLVVAALRGRTAPIPLPGRAIPVAVLAWASWMLASLVWSVDARFTAQELKGDVLWGLVTIVIFYVAATAAPRGFAVLATTIVGAFAVWTALAIGMALTAAGWDSRLLHRGEGAFATYLVTAAPFLLLLVWRTPAGMLTGARARIAFAVLVGLLIAAARLSDNRIIWIALAAAAVVVVFCMRRGPDRRRLIAGTAVLLVVFALLFLDAARDRAAQIDPDDPSVTEVIATDPRLGIWRQALQRIAERPWLGYGYGQHILGREIGADTGDARIQHAHNLFVSQWLQTGAIGAALLALMLGAIAARFVRFVRSGDVALVRLGALGLAVLVAFTIRNLTDDFFSRANGKLLFAACAILLGAGALRCREIGRRA